MTIEQLEALEALEREATADGWKVEITVNNPWSDRFDIRTMTGAPICAMTCQTDTECTANAAVIAAARNALPALLAVAKAAKAYYNASNAAECVVNRYQLGEALSRLEAQ